MPLLGIGVLFCLSERLLDQIVQKLEDDFSKQLPQETKSPTNPTSGT